MPAMLVVAASDDPVTWRYTTGTEGLLERRTTPLELAPPHAASTPHVATMTTSRFISVQPLHGIAPFSHLGDELLAVLRVARKERQLDAGVADGDVRRLAFVLDLDDIDALGSEQVEELRELARLVGEPCAEDEVAPA